MVERRAKDIGTCGSLTSVCESVQCRSVSLLINETCTQPTSETVTKLAVKLISSVTSAEYLKLNQCLSASGNKALDLALIPALLYWLNKQICCNLHAALFISKTPESPSTAFTQ